MLGEEAFSGSEDEEDDVGYDRETFYIDISEFAFGPDTFNSEEKTGQRLYLVEDLPRTVYDDTLGVYAVTNYEWDDEHEELDWLGFVTGLEPIFNKESLDSACSAKEVESLSDGQYNLIECAYKSRLKSLFRNCIFGKEYEVYDETFYMEVPDKSFPRQLKESIDSILDEMSRHQERLDADEEKPTLNPEESREFIETYEALSDEQRDNIGEIIVASLEIPHEGSIKHVHHSNYVATVEYEPLPKPLRRTIEHIHNGLFWDARETALVLSLYEWGWNQSRIADELGKDQSTISQQLSLVADRRERANYDRKNPANH